MGSIQYPFISIFLWPFRVLGLFFLWAGGLEVYLLVFGVMWFRVRVYFGVGNL